MTQCLIARHKISKLIFVRDYSCKICRNDEQNARNFKYISGSEIKSVVTEQCWIVSTNNAYFELKEWEGMLN